jgi:hypothetical protein
MDKFKIETDRLLRVAESLGRCDGDLSECLMPDLKHLCEILARLTVLQDLAPGFLDELFEISIPHFIKMHNKARIGAMAQSKADDAGFGNEWRAAIEAGNDPHQKDYIARMIEVHMKANDTDEKAAIDAMADQTGRDIDSIKRVVSRSKARRKN